MATFEELLNLMRNPDEGFSPDEDYLNSLAEAHTLDMQGVAGQAEIISNDLLQKEEVIKELNSALSAQKAKNYDLLTQLPNNDSGDDSSNDESDDESPDIDDLFE